MRGHGSEGGIEIRMSNTPPFTRTAIVTTSPAVDRLGEIGRTGWSNGATQLFFGTVAELNFLAGHRHRRKKLSVWDFGQAFRQSRDAEIRNGEPDVQGLPDF